MTLSNSSPLACGDKETFCGQFFHAAAVAKIRFTRGVDFCQITVELLAQGGRLDRVDDVTRDEVDDVLPFVHGFGNTVGGEVVVDILHFVDDGWSEAVVGGLAESLHAVEVEGAVGFAEANGQLAHGRLGKESTLLRDVDIGTVAAVGEQREGGHDVIYGIVRVGALQVECFK